MKNRILLIILFSTVCGIPMLHASDKPNKSAGAPAKAAQKEVDQKQAQQDILVMLGARHSDYLQWHILHNYWRPMHSRMIGDNTRALVPVVVKGVEKGELLQIMRGAESLWDWELSEINRNRSFPVYGQHVPCFRKQIGVRDGSQKALVTATGYADGIYKWTIDPLHTARIKDQFSVAQIAYVGSLYQAGMASPKLGRYGACPPIKVDDTLFDVHCTLSPGRRTILEANYNFDFTAAQQLKLQQLNKAQAALVPAKK